jgi:hypothetical protein
MASNSEYSYKSDSTNPFEEANSIRISPSLEVTSTNLASIPSELSILNNIPSEEDILSEKPEKLIFL